jgi:hypothetical protein
VYTTTSKKSNIFPWYDLLMESDNVLRIDRLSVVDVRTSGRKIYGGWREASEKKMSMDTHIKHGRAKANSINVWTNYCFYASFVNFNIGVGGDWWKWEWKSEWIIMMS